MQLNHDSAGFLTGDTITDIKRSADLLSAIRADVAAIKSAVIGMNRGEPATSNPAADPVIPGQSESNSAPVPNQVQAENPTVPPQPAEPRGRREQTEAAVERSRTSRAQADNPAEPRARDASSRFSGGGRRQNREASEPPSSRDNRGRFTSNGDSGDQQQRTLINGLGDRIAETITGFDSGLEEVDPTVKAFNEVAQPLANSYQAFFGGDEDKKKTRWFRRILGELRRSRQEDTTFNRAARRSLGHIEDNTESGDGDGGDSFIGGLLGSISPWVMTAITGVGAALLAGIGAVLGVIFSPIGLAIGAAATAAWGLFTEDGRKFFADMGDKIAAGWDKAVAWFTKSSPKTMELLNKGVEKVSQGADAFVKNSPKTTAALGNVKDKANYGLDVISDLGSRAKAKITGRAANNKNALINAMLSAGITDPEEQAAFLAQNDHESAGFSRLEENLNYKSPSRLMDISKTARSKGKAAVQSAVEQGPEAVGELLYGGRKDLGNTEAGDGYKFRGRGFSHLTGRANYAAAGKALGIDLVNNPDAAADPETAAKIAAWFHQRDKKLVEASQNGDIKTARKRLNGGLNGIDDVSKKYNSYLAEASTGKYAAVKVPITPTVAAAPAQSVFLPSPKIPKAPSPLAVQESPGVIQPLASNAGDKMPFISLPNADVGQNLSDRTIAHIQMGGIGGV